MTDLKITSGVAPFDGALFTLWYAYADVPGGRSLTGKNRYFKILARRDERRLVARLRRLPYADSVPRFDQ